MSIYEQGPSRAWHHQLNYHEKKLKNAHTIEGGPETHPGQLSKPTVYIDRISRGLTYRQRKTYTATFHRRYFPVTGRAKTESDTSTNLTNHRIINGLIIVGRDA